MTPRATPVLEARGVGRRFLAGDGSSVTALADAHVAVAAGELLVLTGPSGSGKTTLLHLLAGIDTPDEGEVLLEGRPLGALDAAARADLRLAKLGLVFADHNLSPALTAAENVDLPLSVRGIPAAERARRVADALGRLGVGHLGGRFPDALSSGEQQRVAVARALAGDPVLLVADEPTAHLDGATAVTLVDTLAELVSERGVAAVVATHDGRLVGRATRVVALEDGRLVGDGAAAGGAR